MLIKICSGFNIVDELYAMITQLQMEARSIKNVETRKQAEEFIRSLTEFCEALEKDTNRKISGPMKLQETYKPIGNDELPFQSKRHATTAPQTPGRQRVQAHGGRTRLISQWNNDENEEENRDEGTSVATKLSQILGGVKPSEKLQSNKPSSTLKGGSPNPVSVSVQSVQHRGPIQSPPSALTPDQINSFTNHELLSRHTQCLDANDTKNLYLITNELQKRASGKSIGPLTPDEQRILLQHSKNFDRYDSAHLRHELLHLQESIGKTVENDIQQLASVPRDMLLKAAAAYIAHLAASSTISNTKPDYRPSSPTLFNTSNYSGATPISHQFGQNYKTFGGASSLYKPPESMLGGGLTSHQPDIGFQSYVFQVPQPGKKWSDFGLEALDERSSIHLLEQTTKK